MRVFLLTGKRHAGKSTAVYDLVQRRPGHWGGVVCVPVFEGGQKVGSDAVDVMTGERVSFARTSGEGIRVGRYHVSPAGIAHGRRAIERAVREGRPVIVDEVGRLELRGEGFMPSVRWAVAEAPQVLLVVREELQQEVAEKLGLTHPAVLSLCRPLAEQL
ncbi:MAG TPA: DUF2478 domain-containing protein [Thermoplasmatales archaeon]|nr:DUF2478 domain-containing protein [Thermoplasmatales archaeon]